MEKNFDSTSDVNQSYKSEYDSLLHDRIKYFKMPEDMPIKFNHFPLGTQNSLIQQFSLETFDKKGVLAQRIGNAISIDGINRTLYLFLVLNHKNILKCLGVAEKDSGTYLIFEFHSLTLHDYLRHRQDRDSIICIITGLDELFEYLTNKQIYITQLTTQDILLDNHNNPKLWNFENAINLSEENNSGNEKKTLKAAHRTVLSKLKDLVGRNELINK
jgi:Protein tyrosine and serine/threonine kinase